MTTTMTPHHIALGPDAVIHVGDDLALRPFAVTSSFWSHDPSDRPELSQGQILSVFDYTETWAYWERHPTGDELFFVLSGSVELLLDDGRERRSIALDVGQAAIVPTGVWHTSVIHAPSRVLFITPTPARTEQRPA